MTSDELRDLYLRLGGTLEHWKMAGPVVAVRYIALECWIAERPESSDTRELRRQLRYLKRHGRFDYGEVS